MGPYRCHEGDIEEDRVSFKGEDCSSGRVRHGQLLGIETFSDSIAKCIALKLVRDIVNADETSPGHAVVAICAV